MVDHVSIHSSEMKGTMRVYISVYFLLELNRRSIARQRIPFSQVPPSNKSGQPAKQEHKPSLINPIFDPIEHSANTKHNPAKEHAMTESTTIVAELVFCTQPPK